MIALIMTILCSTSIALILKNNDVRGGHPLLLLVGNYFIAAVIGVIFIFAAQDADFSLQTFIFGAVLASIFVTAFFAFARAVAVAGTALATVSSRLSVVVPLALSVIIYREIPNVYQVFGILMALITIYLFYKSLKNDRQKSLRLIDYFYLLAVLVGIGINDFAMKVFQQWRPAAEKPFFIFVIFLFAFIFSSIIVWAGKIKFEKRILLMGGVLGIPNVFSTFFLLMALASLPAIVVYPLINIGIILLTAISAAFIWQEKLNQSGRWALISGILAIVLLGQ